DDALPTEGRSGVGEQSACGRHETTGLQGIVQGMPWQAVIQQPSPGHKMAGRWPVSLNGRTGWCVHGLLFPGFAPILGANPEKCKPAMALWFDIRLICGG